MTEELKVIAEIFNNVTDGAIYGGLAFLAYKLVVDITPWVVFYLLGSTGLNLLSKVRITKKTED